MRMIPSVLAFVLLPGLVLAADPTREVTVDARKESEKARSFVSIVKQGDGVFALDIDYPWQSYSNTSVEVWLLPKDKPQDIQPHPLRIVFDKLNGAVSIKVGQCLEAGLVAGKVDHVEHNGLKLDIVGLRNSMGKPSVCFAGKGLSYLDKELLAKEEEEETRPKPRFGSWAGFCELDHWSLNRHHLQLDLLKPYFAKPGTLYVWFLRADTVLWQANLDWQGYE